VNNRAISEEGKRLRLLAATHHRACLLSAAAGAPPACAHAEPAWEEAALPPNRGIGIITSAPTCTTAHLPTYLSPPYCTFLPPPRKGRREGGQASGCNLPALSTASPYGHYHRACHLPPSAPTRALLRCTALPPPALLLQPPASPTPWGRLAAAGLAAVEGTSSAGAGTMPPLSKRRHTTSL